MSLLCKLFGHNLVALGERLGIAGAHGCTRCSYYSPAIMWPRGADKPMMVGHVPPRPMPQPSPSRPAPPMPECKPPMPEHQVLKAKAGDTVVITTERPMCKEQCEKIAEYAKRGLPDGIKVLILDSGMKIAVVSQQPDRPIPHIPMPSPAR